MRFANFFPHILNLTKWQLNVELNIKNGTIEEAKSLEKNQKETNLMTQTNYRFIKIQNSNL